MAWFICNPRRQRHDMQEEREEEKKSSIVTNVAHAKTIEHINTGYI